MTNDHDREKENRSPAKTPSSSMSRRSFLKMGVGAVAALGVLEFGIAGYFYLQATSLSGAFGGVMSLGAADSFPKGSVTEFMDGQFFLIRADDGGFLAVYRRCPHLGCTVNWEAAQHRFHCPCHASTFDFYGDFMNPPVPRALDTFPVRFDGGVVQVDTSELEEREHFHPEQLTYL